jgi:hypothetical protein
MKAKKQGCLYYLLIWPFVVLFQIMGKVWKTATATPERKRITYIASGSLIGLCCLYVMVVSALDSLGIIDLSTPEPTLDLAAVQFTAEAAAWLPYTQTAEAIPTSTETLTSTPTETSTTTLAPPTDTPPPTNTSGPPCDCQTDIYRCDAIPFPKNACINYCQSLDYSVAHLDGDGDGRYCE